jgi:hypothetical protein
MYTYMTTLRVQLTLMLFFAASDRFEADDAKRLELGDAAHVRCARARDWRTGKRVAIFFSSSFFPLDGLLFENNNNENSTRNTTQRQ